jgi:hypothetical protein
MGKKRGVGEGGGGGATTNWDVIDNINKTRFQINILYG